MMKNMLLAMVVLGGFIGSIVGSEQPNKQYDELNKSVEIFVSFNSDDRKLFYVGGKKMEYLKQKPAANSPCFINCKYTSKDLRTNLPYMLDCMLNSIAQSSKINTEDDCKQYRLLENSTRLQKITENFEVLFPQNVIPLHYFLTDKDQFKKKGDILFSFMQKVEEDDILFEVKLGQDLSNIKAQEIITQFCDKVQYVADDRNELETKKIIKITNNFFDRGGYTHGDLSYKAERENKRLAEKAAVNLKKAEEEKKQNEQKVQEKALFYSKIKKLCGFSAAVFIMYCLYQQIYAVA